MVESRTVSATTGQLLAYVRSMQALGTKDLDLELESTHLAVARMLTARAKVIAKVSGHPATRKAADFISAKPSSRAALVVQGTKEKGNEWVLGALFGAYPDQDRTLPSGRTVKGWNQFPMARPGGYSIYPAIAQEADRTNAIYAAAVERIIGKALSA